MSFCTRSQDNLDEGVSWIDNAFLHHYMPTADPDTLKVYLYGLYLTSAPLSLDNSIAHMCDALAMQEAEIMQAFSSLAESGLVEIISYQPLRIKYRIARNLIATRHYKKDKYTDFNQQLEQLFPSVAFTSPNQYTPYYDLMEETRIKPEVLLMIVRYCIRLKGEKVHTNYILAVARSWIAEGVRTIEDVDARICHMDTVSEASRQVAAAVSKRSEIGLEEKQLYIKWTQTWGFSQESILVAAKQCKNRGGFEKLDRLLDEFFHNQCLSVQDITDYCTQKRKMREYATTIVRKLGLWYDSVEPVVEKYVAPWIGKGFDPDALYRIADYCFTNSIRTLDGMQSAVQKFYLQGCTSVQAIQTYLGGLVEIDNRIRELLNRTASARNVTANDRNLYAIWTRDWGFTQDALAYAADRMQGKAFAFSNMHTFLSRCHAQGLHSVEQMQSVQDDSPRESASQSFNKNDRKYTKEELSAFFDTFDSMDTGEI